jgi:hypothetical protein
MAQEFINVGTAPDDGLGDPIRDAYIKCNDNFSELYSRVQVNPPTTPIGSPGDSAGMYAYDENYFYYCYANYNGVSQIWGEVSEIGNVVLPSISNGNSNVDIANSGGNINFSVNGVANVAVLSDNVLSLSANIVSTANISGTYILGDGSQLTGLPQVYSNANVQAYLPTYNGGLNPSTIVTGAIITDGYFFANGQPFTGSGGGTGNVDLPNYTGNLGGTLTQSNQPNITGVGTLAELTVSSISNIDFQAIASDIDIFTTFGGTVVISSDAPGTIDNMRIGCTTPSSATFTTVATQGNVTASYFIGDGSQLTNVGGGGGNYGNADVANYLPTYTGNLNPGNITTTGTLAVVGNSTFTGTVNTQTITGNLVGQLTGPVNGVNLTYGIWDFGSISGTTFDTPIAWIFAQTSAGNIDMGTVPSPSPNNIDIGTIY